MFNIPRLKDRIQLTKDWKFFYLDKVETLEAGTILIVEKLEEKKINNRYYSSFIRFTIPKRINKNKPHTGVKLDFSLTEVYDMEFISFNENVVNFKRDLLTTLKEMPNPVSTHIVGILVESLDKLTNYETFSTDAIAIANEFKSSANYRLDKDKNDVLTIASLINVFMRKYKIEKFIN